MAECRAEVRVDVNAEYTYEIPQTEENTNDPSPEHVEEADNFRITASETTAGEKIVKIPVNTIQGEKYLPYQKFKPNLEIPASIVNVENSECYTTIINSSDNEQYFDIKTPMEADDFEIPTNEAQMPNFDEAQINRYLNENVNQLRLNHLNNKEKKTIKDLYFKYKDILYNEKMPLTFNKANQQQIKVKDGTMPTYTKSYRYPHIHKEEVRKQTYEKPFEKIHIDTFSVQNSDFLTIVDAFTKIGQAYHIEGKTAIEIFKPIT
ncbi:hypothetical protein QE152_g19093 [Popillia japonica]|uniref:Uncharacterized protein n=1 Tax=Popillia japonica TaxID=7064 RepID=A0AAW1L310_POPJA